MARLGVPIGGQGRRLARARPNQTIGEQQMCSNDLNQWTARTAAVHALFPTWSAEVRCLDLAEEAVQLVVTPVSSSRVMLLGGSGIPGRGRLVV
jgi:hypothetical protein